MYLPQKYFRLSGDAGTGQFTDNLFQKTGKWPRSAASGADRVWLFRLASWRDCRADREDWNLPDWRSVSDRTVVLQQAGRTILTPPAVL